MAVHPDFPGLRVEIVVNDDPLQEYNNTDPEPSLKTVTNYIEASDETQFKVRLAIPEGLFKDHGVRAAIRLDGADMAREIYQHQCYRYIGVNTSVGSSSAYINGLDMGQDFQFSKLDVYEATQTVDDSLPKALASMGQVSVVFHAIKNARPKVVENRLPGLRQYESVPEKALKGSSLFHSASLGPLQSRSRVSWFKIDYVHSEHHPFAIFHFKYRSLDALKCLCIVPRTPSPTPLEERPIEDLNAAELAQLVTQYRTQRVKRERNTTVELDRTEVADLDDDDVTVIEERSSKRWCQPFKRGEVIVLD